MKNKTITILLILNLIATIGMLNFLIKGQISKEKEILKEMTESEQVSGLQTQLNTLNESHEEYARNVQSYKRQIASAITDMGIETAENADASTMSSNIRSLTGASSADLDLLLTFSISNPSYLTEHFYTDIVEDISDGWKILTNGSIRFLGYAMLAADGGSAGSITIKINDVDKYSLSVDSTSQMQIDVTLDIDYGDTVEIYCVGSSINGQYYGNRVVTGKLHMIVD